MHLVFTLYLIMFPPASISTWNYDDEGPEVWSDEYPLCAGYFQSPINIRTACSVYQSYELFRFSKNYNISRNFTLVNNGHTILARQNVNRSLLLSIYGGGLNGTFQFVNFHLHWGKNYKSGSEHRINNEKYAGELHFIYLNPETYQFAVLAILIQSTRDYYRSNKSPKLSYRNNAESTSLRNNDTMKEWGKYLSIAGTLKNRSLSAMLSLNLATLMGNDLNEFWRYRGSLTTPPCTEDVVWTVFKYPILFSEHELSNLRRNIHLEVSREPQLLHNRIVYRNFVNETLVSIGDGNCCFKHMENGSRSTSITFLNPTISLFLLVNWFWMVFL